MKVNFSYILWWILLYLHPFIYVGFCNSHWRIPISQKEVFVTVFWIDLSSVL